jgi:hypothetical protein
MTQTNTPQYIRDILLSVEYNQFLVDLKKSFLFIAEQHEKFGDILKQLFAKTLSVLDIESTLQKHLGLSPEQTHLLTRSLFVNVILPFPALFGNHIEYAQKTFGDIGKDIEQSPTFLLLLRAMNDALQAYAQSADELEKNKEKEARDMVALFESELVCHFYPPDGAYKTGLNNTIIYLLGNVEDFAPSLLSAMYNNNEHLGKIKISTGDKMDLPPTVANWIQDFLGFSGGMVSSIKLAQYFTDNANVKNLSDRDREALRRLLETFATLKDYPQSFQKITPEHWMVIPYHIPEMEAKTARELPPISTASVQDTIPTPQVAVLSATQTSSQPPQTSAPELSGAPSLAKSDQMPMMAVAQKELPPLPPTPSAAPIEYDRVAEHIVNKTALKFSDDILSRVKTIVMSRVRNIRNSIDTGERLKAAGADGGAGLSAEDADKLLKEANSAFEAITSGKIGEYLPTPPKPAEEKSAGASQEALPEAPATALKVEMSLVAQVPVMTIKEIGGVPTVVEKKNGNGKKKVSEATPTSSPAQVQDSAPSVPQAPRGPSPSPQQAPAESLPVQPTPPVSVQTPPVPPAQPSVKATIPSHLADAQPIPVAVRAAPSGGGHAKKPVADVKAAPRLVGVVDEIRALTIKDFRRISQSPGEAAKRILQKIQQLEKESLTKKAEAIKAWKESDVYALYLEIGQINLGVDMNKLVEERKAAGKEYLTSEEFDALLDLNEKLRF